MDDRVASSGLQSLKSIPEPLPLSAIEPLHLAIPFSGEKASFLETSVGTATIVLLRGLLSDEDIPSKVFNGAVEVLEGAIDQAIKEELDSDGCEVLYGRAGLLYALLLLRRDMGGRTESINPSKSESFGRAVKGICSDENLRSLVDDIVKRGRMGAREYAKELGAEERDRAPPLMWVWHGKRYLGAAHGVGEWLRLTQLTFELYRFAYDFSLHTAGILHMLICCPKEIIFPHWPTIEQTIEWLLAIQDSLGNWPSKAGRHMTYVEGGSAYNSNHGAHIDVPLRDEYEDVLIQ